MTEPDYFLPCDCPRAIYGFASGFGAKQRSAKGIAIEAGL
jgi:hypothetical protein